MTISLPSSTTLHPVIGKIQLFSSAEGLSRLTFAPLSASLALPEKPITRVMKTSPELRSILEQLLGYFAGQKIEFSVPLDWSSFSSFQRQVFQYTCTITYGQVQTYGQIAADLGKPGAARAVGAALASNPIPILIPCHRVIGADGSLHGYSAPGGLQTKAWLLALEGHTFLPGNRLKLAKDSYGNFS